MSVLRFLMVLAFGGVVLLHPLPLRAGECWFPEGCTEPCPAENSCPYGDADCEEGMWCVPSCLPSMCICRPSDGVWGCTWDCAGECVERPVWTGPPDYVIVPLWTLGGWSSVALAVNDCGQVVGGADTREGLRHAFLWDAGEMIDLGTTPGTWITEAWDVNNNGQVVGIALEYSGGPERAFLWQDGKMIDLGTLGGDESDADAINDAGQIVGISRTASGETHSFLWEDGVMIDLLETYGVGGAADINALSHIAASAYSEDGPHAGLWDGTSIIDLGTLGGQFSYSTALNDLSQVVGASERAPGGDRIFHAFLWDDGEMTDLGAIGGFIASHAEGINNRGQVTGSPSFLYDPEKGMQDLMDLISPYSGWRQLSPRNINDAGQIVGAGWFYGWRVAFLMTPLDADFDDDEDTDLEDFAAFRSCMTGPGELVQAQCKERDINRNGRIDMIDLRAFQWVFGEP